MSLPDRLRRLATDDATHDAVKSAVTAALFDTVKKRRGSAAAIAAMVGVGVVARLAKKGWQEYQRQQTADE